MQVYDLSPQAGPAPSILALKLDHLGDFIIGAPALRRLREAFPRSSIRLVVGSWNRAAAEALDVADEVRTLDVFPPSGGGGVRSPGPAAEAAALDGAFDIALDLRLDDDTRPWLARVDARLRCGIGPAGAAPGLDVVLPAEPRWEVGWSPHRRSEAARFGPGEFKSRLPVQGVLRHEGPLAPIDGHVIYGPDLHLAAGAFEVRFDLSAEVRPWRRRGTRVTLDVACDGREIGASRVLDAADLPRPGDPEGVVLPFENTVPGARFEFRAHLGGRRAPGRLVFGGATVVRVGAEPPPRLRPTSVHVGERLSQLVELVRDRATPLHAVGEAAQPRSGEVVVAPFSNSDLRDWPAASYAELIGRLVREGGRRVALVGAPRQGEALERLRQASGAAEAVDNLGGRTAWADLPDRLRRADLVICNNSGVAHAAAAAGGRVLALYSASHPPHEWGPRGPRSEALMTAVPCSPCGFDVLAECPFSHRCMTELTPEIVFAEALRRLAEDDTDALA